MFLQSDPILTSVSTSFTGGLEFHDTQEFGGRFTLSASHIFLGLSVRSNLHVRPNGPRAKQNMD